MAAILRPAIPEDVDRIRQLIAELAEYERSPDLVESTREDLVAALFGPDPAVWCTMVEFDGVVVGMTLWFLTFSTWTGKHGIYVEDLIITESARGRGLGKMIFRHLAQICAERDYARIDLSVLDWNEPSIEFYKSIGARHMHDWNGYRVDGDALSALAHRMK